MNYKKNKEDRLWMIKYWANYIRTHPDQEWSKQQALLINSIIRSINSSTLEQ